MIVFGINHRYFRIIRDSFSALVKHKLCSPATRKLERVNFDLIRITYIFSVILHVPTGGRIRYSTPFLYRSDIANFQAIPLYRETELQIRY